MILENIGHCPDHQFRKEATAKKVGELWYPRPTRKKEIIKDEVGKRRICQLYLEDYTLRELADWFLVSYETIRTILKKAGILRRHSSKDWQPRIGKEIKTNGYIHVYMGRGFPGASQKGWIAKHRLIMQNHLGRTLSSGEVVHHKDRNKQNNEISNLEVMLHKDHPTCEHCPYYMDYVKRTSNKYFVVDLT